MSVCECGVWCMCVSVCVHACVPVCECMCVYMSMHDDCFLILVM